MMNRVAFLACVLCMSVAALSQSVGDNIDIRPLLFKQFIKGSVFMKDSTVYSTLLNYNSSNQEILFISDNQYLELDDFDHISYVQIDERTFVPVNKKFYEKTADPFVLIGYFNVTVAQAVGADKVATSLKNANEVSNTVSAYTNSIYTNRNDVQLQKYYFILKEDSKLKRLVTNEDFAKEFKTDKAVIKNYINNNRNFTYNSTSDIIQLIDFLRKNK